ncbi:MAG TPA: MBG domain-containing protein [Vicinamibacterales bacterium]|nr:MBG domain-containing protein [Vicinamibacterales bacterium]
MIRTAIVAAVVAAAAVSGGYFATLRAQAGIAAMTVPWLGSPTAAHQTYSGASIVLQGVAKNGANQYFWDFGDGTAAQPWTNIGNPYDLSVQHVYTAADDTPFTATLTVRNSATPSVTASAQFPIVVKHRTLDVDIDMAIDRGLWNIHTKMSRGTFAAGAPGWGAQYGFWSGSGQYAPTAAALQAFGVNNHQEGKNAGVDPYQEDVARGLAFLDAQLVPVNIGTTPNGNNPDANGNGIGLTAGADNTYILGAVIDAYVAAGNKNGVAVAGQASVKGRTYKDLVQDMVDFNSGGQNDFNNAFRGGWGYTANSGIADNSTGQWPAIGNIAAERAWGVTVPAFVKAENLFWVNFSQDHSTVNTDFYRGSFGYQGAGQAQCAWSCEADTAGGLIQGIMDGWRYDEGGAGGTPQFRAGVEFMARSLRQNNDFIGATPVTGANNFYMMYAFTKTMRLALGPDGTPKPITMISDSVGPPIDWFRNDPGTTGTGPVGLARALVTKQLADGSWPSGFSWTPDLTTPWSVIMLSPSVFQTGPKASCTVSPVEIGSTGTTVVNFDGTATIEPNPDAQITSYQWAFGDNGTATGSTAAHTYGIASSFPHTYNATLTVTDSNGVTDTASCPVTQVDTNVAPTAVIGGNAGAGEYSLCPGGQLTLDGSGSSDPEDAANLIYRWDLTSPLTFSPVDESTAMVDATSRFSAMPPGVYNIGLQVVDTQGKTGTAFGHVTVKAADDATCNQPPVAHDDVASTTSQTPVTINVLANDSDPDAGQTLSVTSASTPASGAATTDGTTVSYTSNKGFAGTDTFTYTVSDGHGGTATANVTVTVTKRAASVTAGSASKVYGQTDPSITASSTGFTAADGITVSASRDAGENTGTYATHAAASGDLANYSVTYADGTFKITAAALTITAASQSMIYGGPVPALTASYSGLVNGDTAASLTPAAALSTSATSASGVGSYPITVVGAASPNYTITFVNGTLSVTPAPLVASAANATRQYGSGNPQFTGAVSGVRNGDAIVETFSTPAAAASPVGGYPIVPALGGAALSNYSVSLQNGTLTVTPAALVVKANDAVKTVGSPNPAFTASYAGFVLGDSPVVLGGTLTFATPATVGSPVGSYPITPSGLSAANYTMTFVPGTLTVTTGVCVLFDNTKAVKSGATIPIKLQLCDSSGNNLSSPSITLHATSVSQLSTSSSWDVQDAGNANPDDDFRYSPPQYIFNLKTTGLGTGTYQLNFAVSGDPTPHSVTFSVR